MIELFSRALSWVGRLASIRIVCYGCVALILCLCAQLLVNRTSPSFSETFSSSRTQRISSKLPVCPEKPPGLLGKFSVSNDPKTAPSWLELENSIPHVRHGGYQPEDCVAKQRVAIIVPYRNRDSHLRLLLSVLHPMLRRQQLDYRIFVIEQAGTTRFNRASLLNIGFVEAEKNFKADCYIFHDVDLLPEHDHNIYRCGSQPRHVSPAMDKFGYRFPFIDGFFGVCSLTGKQFRFVNGLSNVFFGWGGEDDDFYRRLGWAGYNVSRYPMSIARYRMIRHNSDYLNDPNPQRVKLVVQGRKRWKKDGINSLKYSVTGVQDRRVVYIVTVDIPVAEILRRSLAGHLDGINQLAQKRDRLRSRTIDTMLVADQEAKKREVQLLMIGGTGSGKSTLLRQMRIHHGDAFPDEKRRRLAGRVLENLADGVQIVLENMRARDSWFKDDYVRDMAAEFLAHCPRFNSCIFRVPHRLEGVVDSIHYARVEFADACTGDEKEEDSGSDTRSEEDEMDHDSGSLQSRRRRRHRRRLCQLVEAEEADELESGPRNHSGSESPSLIFYYDVQAKESATGAEAHDATDDSSSATTLNSRPLAPSYVSTLDFASLRRQLDALATEAAPRKAHVGRSADATVARYFVRHLKNITAQPEFDECLREAEYFRPEITYAELYFIRHVDRLIQEDYVPSLQDILAIRRPNHAVREANFLVGGCAFRIIDLADHRRQRCRWLHYFEDVSAVLFIASLTGFAELIEDGDRITVKMTECLKLFAEVANNKHLWKKDLFLFLNKLDLFEQALQKKSIAGLFPDYRGRDEVSESSQFIKEKFLSLLPKNLPKSKRVFAHVVSAIDIEGMRSSFGEVLRRVAEANLKRTLHVF